MGLIDILFKNKDEDETSMYFGRYTDLYKDDDKYSSWDKALIATNEDQHIDAVAHFLDYLTDEKTQNLTYTKNNGEISFQFYQGSKVVNGIANSTYFKAEAKIAKCKKPHLSVFRAILEENHNLKYTKYCLDPEQNLTLVFQTSHLDANPYKLYYGLKEMSTIADHKDDALVSKYTEFDNINISHIEPDTTHVMNAKYEYFINEITALLESIKNGELTSRENVGGLAYMICSFTYKMDYLLLPEGILMQQLEQLIHLAGDGQSNALNENISEIMFILTDLQKKTKEELSVEFYQSLHTFGVTTPVDHKHIINLINSNMSQLKWYVSNANARLSKAVCTFVFGKLLYEHAIPAFEKDLIHLYFQITESVFFRTCGLKSYTENGKIKKADVIRRLKSIEKKANKKFDGLEIDYSRLIWDVDTFAPSFVHMMLTINYNLSS